MFIDIEPVVNEAKDVGDTAADRKTEQGQQSAYELQIVERWRTIGSVSDDGPSQHLWALDIYEKSPMYPCVAAFHPAHRLLAERVIAVYNSQVQHALSPQSQDNK